MMKTRGNDHLSLFREGRAGAQDTAKKLARRAAERGGRV